MAPNPLMPYNVYSNSALVITPKLNLQHSMALLKLLDNTSPNKLRYHDILAKIKPFYQSVCFCHHYETFALNKSLPLFLDRALNVGHTTSADHLRVCTGNLLEISAGFVPMAPDQVIPTGQAGSG